MLGRLGAALVVFLSPASAQATGIPTIHDNYQSFPIGSRAAGMGGAYTALACDEASLHYNPASLACAGASRLELAANAYQLQGLDIPHAFGKSQHLSAMDFQSLPAIAGFVRVLMDGEPDTSGRLALGFAVEIPHSLSHKVAPADPNKADFMSFAIHDNITAADLGIAYQFHKAFGAGLSIGGALRTFEFRSNELLVSRQTVPCGPADVDQCWEFLSFASEMDLWAIGLRGKLGMRVAATDELSFGLAVVSPTIDVYGSGTIVETNALGLVFDDGVNFGAEYGPGVARATGSSDISLPFRIAVGGAYSTESFTISFDASLNFPHTVDMLYDYQAEDIDGFGRPSSDDLEDAEYHFERTLQPNFNLGVEFALTDGVLLDLGAFTDLSSVSDKDIEELYSDRVHMFGGSLALGFVGEQIRSWYGLSFEYGVGDAKVMGGELDLDSVFTNSDSLWDSNSTISKWNLTGFIGANYSFFDEEDDVDAPAAGAGAAAEGAPAR